MWDADLIKRVRDRKLNEIMIFASMAKIDSSRVDSFIDIIVSLGDDIDACDTLMDTSGDAEIELDSITSEEYLSRLSDSELRDEEAFNALKSEPVPRMEDINIEEYVRGLISDAVESLRSDNSSSDAVDALKDEVRSCRARIDQLTMELEDARIENAALSDEIESVRSDRDAVVKQADEARSKIASLKMDLELANQKISVLEPAYQEASARISELESCATRSEPAKEDAVEPDVVPVSEEQPQRFLSNNSIESLVKVREMKNSKIDALIESAMAGNMDMEVCDDIVEFLKADVAICDAILGIDFDVKSSVLAGFKQILKIASESPDPKHQDEYIAMISPEESMLEYNYAQAINSLQGMMMYMSEELKE